MTKEQLFRLGLTVLLLTIIITGYGGLCKKKSDDDDVITGSSAPLPAQVTSPDPANEATDVPITTTQLAWATATGATSYNVYFGTTNPPSYVTNTANTSYNLGALSLMDTYYWRIDSKNSAGTTTGNVWSLPLRMDTGARPQSSKLQQEAMSRLSLTRMVMPSRSGPR